MDIIKIENLSKSFGELKVIENLNMTVHENSVFGFIGKNGSGKTTTMKMVLGFLNPDKGNISVCGELVKYGNTHTNRLVGYLPDVPEFYGYMSPKEYLKLCGEIAGLPLEKTLHKIDELLPLVGLDNAAKRKIKGFSRGMKQRLGIAQALLNEPKLLICDEPTSALDPVGRREILDILLNVKNKTTIIFSTHILSDVESICDTVGILNNGNIAMEGKLSDIKSSYRSDHLILQVFPSKKLSVFTEQLNKLPSINKIDYNNIKNNSFSIFTTDLSKTSIDIVKLLSENNIQLQKFEVNEPDLEQLFMEVVRR